MKRLLRASIYSLLLLCCSFATTKTYANHIYGADLFYTYQSGNTYQVTLVIYADCGSASSSQAFGLLPTDQPEIQVYNGTSLYTTFNLSVVAPSAGTEVTPVCAADINNTACSNPNNTIPGVKKFTYSGNVTLNATSANWLFHFDHVLSGPPTNSVAGRSATITNIVNPGPTLITLDATLNNVSGNNTSPTYTTIPTPFFCINKPANYNSGAVDINGDSLSFALVPGQDGSTGVAVSYVTPYTATAPLGTTAGTFSFNSSTGQLSFTPNIAQRALVVYTVTEYRAGVVVGTSQREMSFVVLSSCSNNPPTGSISNPSSTSVTLTDSTDVSVCQSQGIFTFNINPTDPDGNNITVTYAGLPAGATFNVTGNGTTAPSGVFNWNTSTATPGTYTFFITYQDDGCPLSSKQTVAYTITVQGSPTSTFSLVSPATCAKKAVFHVTPGGSGSPYTISILQGATTLQTFTGQTSVITDSLIAGTYTFRVANSSNCYKDTTVTLAAPPAIIPAVTETIPLCAGGSTGTITLTASGGLSPFTYAIGAGAYSNTNTFGSLAAGSYVLHVKDGNFCIKDTTVALADATKTLLAIAITRPSCDHYQNGEIDVTASNTAAPYQYSIGGGAYGNSTTFTGLDTGTFAISVKNANGCITDTSIKLTDSLRVNANLALANILCNSATTGSIVANATGGYGSPYTYAIGAGAYGATNTFSNLPAGSYVVHIRDANLCFMDTTVSLTQPTAIAITPTVTNILCNGDTTGAISAAVTGGISPYTYALNSTTYGSTSTFSPLAAGTYILAVRDNNACIKKDTLSVTQPAKLKISSITTNNVTCNNTSTGSFVVTATGGTTPYSYAVNAGTFGSSSTLGSLAAGTYTVNLKDHNGCEVDTAGLTITQPTAIVPSAQIVNPVCQTLSNGKVILSATGGTPGYTYSYNSNGYSTSGTFNPLAAGTYTFHIKDNNGCIKDTSITLVDSMTISGSFNITGATCYNVQNAAFTVTGVGGTSPYTYALGAGAYSSTNTFSNLAGGSNYTVHIKASNSCIDDTTILVPQPTQIVPQLTVTSPTCFGLSDGSVSVTATGGTPSYTFAMGVNGTYGTTVLYSSLPAGNDTIYVKDANACIHDTIINISQPASLRIAALTYSEVKCYGDSSGFVTVTLSGGTTPYRYSADNSAYQSGNVVNDLDAGNHILHVTDTNGCSLDSTISLTQPDKLAFVTDSLIDPTCQGAADGKIIVNAIGGIAPYLYSTTNSGYSATDTFTQLLEGQYTIYTKDNNNCVYDTLITLTGYPHLIFDEAIVTNPGCNGKKNGSIDLIVTGGTPPLSYFITNGLVPHTTGFFDSLKSGQYTITVQDSFNCQKDTTISLSQPDSLSVDVVSVPNDCVGYDNTGSITLNVTGGTAPYTYLWSTNPPNTTNSISGMPNGNYEIWVTDAGHCTDTVLTSIQYDDCCKPFIPNAFTPNNDGKDDLYRVRFKGDMRLENFSIYNRFGQRVFTTIYVDQGWDGTYNGVPQPLDTYFYYIKVWCGNKEDHEVEMHGDLTLIR